MWNKLLILSLTFLLVSCGNSSMDKNSLVDSSASLVTDTTTKDYATILTGKERKYLETPIDPPGDLITSITFNVKTTDKEYQNGLIPHANLEKPDKDLKNLVDGNKTVISEKRITVVIDYPVTNEYRFDLESKNGFTRELLLKEISRKYYEMYAEEEKSATVKTIPPDKRTTMYNRNETNGKYGIWGHDIADLVLSEVSVFKTPSGQIIVLLVIES